MGFEREWRVGLAARLDTVWFWNGIRGGKGFGRDPMEAGEDGLAGSAYSCNT
jgi:hypothetical protein